MTFSRLILKNFKTFFFQKPKVTFSMKNTIWKKSQPPNDVYLLNKGAYNFVDLARNPLDFSKLEETLLMLRGIPQILEDCVSTAPKFQWVRLDEQHMNESVPYQSHLIRVPAVSWIAAQNLYAYIMLVVWKDKTHCHGSPSKRSHGPSESHVCCLHRDAFIKYQSTRPHLKKIGSASLHIVSVIDLQTA